MFKKILLTLLAFNFLFLSIFTPTVKAQREIQTWYYEDFFNWYYRVFETRNRQEIFGERYTAAQVEWVIYSFFAWIINRVGNKDINWCAIHLLDRGGASNIWEILSGSLWDFFRQCPCIADDVCNLATFGLPSLLQDAACALPQIPNWVNLCEEENPAGIGYIQDSRKIVQKDGSRPSLNYSLLPSRELSFSSYLKGIISKLNPIQEVRAQGFGYNAINPIQRLWTAVRNITYFLSIIAIIILAFMIMFRVKLSPQTVITIQSAIPKIVLSLILITFSYALAGLLIDLMYLSIAFVSTIFTGPFGAGISNHSTIDMFNELISTNIVGRLFWYWIWWLISAMAAADFVFGILGGYFLIFIFWLILIIVLFIIGIKIMWLMLKTFVLILLLIIASPLIIMGGIFGFGGFGFWLRSLLSNLAIYPAVGAFMVLAYYFLASSLGSTQLMPFNLNPNYLLDTQDAWIPPFTMGAGSLRIIYCFVSLIIITLIPNVADIIKSLISGRPFAYGTAIGQVLATGAGIAWTIPGTALGWAKAGVEKAIIERISQTTLAERIASTFGKKKT